MIVEMPDNNSVVRWKKNDNEKWKYAEISDLIKAYEKRPKGEWLLNEKTKNNTHPTCRCSNCGLGIYNYSRTNFCPNCGADMRKGGKE